MAGAYGMAAMQLSNNPAAAAPTSPWSSAAGLATALEGLETRDRALASYDCVYWIAGGRPKEDGLAATLPWLDRVRSAFLIGEAEDAFARELDGKVEVVRCGTLAEAFPAARSAARADGEHHPVVLLSPACASFDQFPNFEARGDAFRALVREIAR